MLKLATSSATGIPIINAYDESLTESINEGSTLDFKLPINDDMGIDVGCEIFCEDELYTVEKISWNDDAKAYNIQCTHSFVYHAKRLHIPKVAVNTDGDFIGTDLQEVLKNAFKNAYTDHFRYGLMRETDYTYLGVKKLSQLIDYESEERTTLWNVIQNIIAAAGQGEVFYTDKQFGRFGIVKLIGSDTDIVLSSIYNTNNVSVEYDISEMITVLYPYGKDELDITSAENNENGTPYIISPMADTYGYVQGHKKYEINTLESSGPDTLLDRALWEFDESNTDRIDVPSVNITGSVTDIGIPEGVHLGDSVTVSIDGILTKERIIKIKRYFDGRPSEVSIGRVKKDMFYYLNQIGVFTQRYKNISTYKGKIYGSKVTGTVKVTANATNADKALSLANTSGQITIDSGGIKILSEGAAFLSANKDNVSIGSALAVASDGTAAANLTSLTLAGNAFTVDADGNLYYNGKKVQLVEEA